MSHSLNIKFQVFGDKSETAMVPVPCQAYNNHSSISSNAKNNKTIWPLECQLTKFSIAIRARRTQKSSEADDEKRIMNFKFSSPSLSFDNISLFV